MHRDNYFLSWLNRSQVWPVTFMSTASGSNSWTWTDLEGSTGVLTAGRRWLNSHPGSIYVVSVGMLPGTGPTPTSGGVAVRAADSLNGGRVSHARGARGDYDNHFEILAQRIVESGIADKTLIRLGWEFNGAWYPWFIDSNSAENGPVHFAANFAHIVQTMKAVPGIPAQDGRPARPGGSTLRFCWNGCVNWTGYNVRTAFPANIAAGTTTTGVSWQAHPGNTYVDYVGLDVYDTSPNTNAYEGNNPPWTSSQLSNAWNRLKNGDGSNSGDNLHNGIIRWQNIADDYDKEMSFPEWGLSDDTRSGHPDGGQDNPYFIDRMYEYVQDPARNVAFHTYYDATGGGSDARIVSQPGGTPTKFPNAARRFKQLWGLPMPTRTEIGSISAVSTADGILVSGGGTGYTTGTTDAFYFTSRTCDATDSFTMKIVAASVAAGQAGVMVRQGTGTGAVYGALEFSNGTLSFRSRSASGAGVLGDTVSGVTLPVWLKVARNGNQVTGYRSTDGLNWIYAGSEIVNFTGSTQIGVAVSSGASGTLNVVEIDSLDRADLVLGDETSITHKIIKDNSELAALTYTGNGASWSTGTTRANNYNGSYRAASAATGAGSIVFNSGITASNAGLYDVYLHWPEGADLHFDTPITVNRVGGSTNLVANQLAGYNQWVHAGTYDLAAGASVAIGNSLTPTYIGGAYSMADVVMFVPLPAPLQYEPETLAGITASDTVSVFSEASASAGAGSKVASNAVGDYIQYPLTNVPAGTYTIKVRYKRNTTRGIFQLSIDGVNHGAPVDEYGTGAYIEVTVGSNKTLTAGTHNFRFTVTGKNSGSSGYDLTVDRITLEQ